VSPTTISDPITEPSLATKVTNFVIFQVSWFICVLSGAGGRPWIALAAMALVVAWHLSRAPRPLPELVLLGAAAVIGALWDGFLAGGGWLVYPSGRFAEWLAPNWIIAMWVGFATTLNVSLRWLHGRYGLAMLLGALGGPIAFLAGSRLGGVSFPEPISALVLLAVGWALITPLFFWLATRLDGYVKTPERRIPERPATEAGNYV